MHESANLCIEQQIGPTGGANWRDVVGGLYCGCDLIGKEKKKRQRLGNHPTHLLAGTPPESSERSQGMACASTQQSLWFRLPGVSGVRCSSALPSFLGFRRPSLTARTALSPSKEKEIPEK